ncbi:Protein muscleblind [Melipona quadrifasciata]|uniref:Protein muscleblind n=1 Tax=Melipona quadrifasciata TaxID=166423 RepID=A0A0N0U6D3_9HYME|nr:Protein muscleblind [Melipona quadrifasciata]
MAMVNMNNLLNGKDSRWLQLEVCREFQRNKCTRPDTECKFAHPPANVEVQNGRVTACYDSIKVTNSTLCYIIEFSPFRGSSPDNPGYSLATLCGCRASSFHLPHLLYILLFIISSRRHTHTISAVFDRFTATRRNAEEQCNDKSIK